MEVLGAVSSVFAVVSLAVQLTSSIQKLIDFWDSVRDAPVEVAQIKSQLRFLSMLLRSIEAGYAEGKDDHIDNLGAECLAICLESVMKLRTLSAELDRGLNGSGVRRKWTRLRKALREPELLKYWNELERAKSMLIIYQGWRNNRHHESLLTMLTHLARSQRAEICDFSSSPSYLVPTSETFTQKIVGFTKGSLNSRLYEFRLSFGTIRVQISATYTRPRGVRSVAGGNIYACKRHKSIVTSFEANFPFASILEWTLRRGYSPWSMSFKTFNLRPDWSPIFDYCISGNISEAQRLIESGQASPMDINSEGMTPLHYAAMFHHSEICRMLIDMGAVANAGTHRLESPLMMAMDENYRKCMSRSDDEERRVNEVSQLDTIRLLVEAGDNDPMEPSDIKSTPLSIGLTSPLREGLTWLLHQDVFDLNFHHKTLTGYTAAALMPLREDFCAEMLAPLIRSGISINGPCADYFTFKFGARIYGPTMLQYTLWVWYIKILNAASQEKPFPPSPRQNIKTLLDHGADLHARSTSGHTVLDGMLLSFVRSDGVPYSVPVLQCCKMAYMDLLSCLGFSRRDRRAYLIHERKLHMDQRPHDLGLGFSMKLQFTEPPDINSPQGYWCSFQGLEEKLEGICLGDPMECKVWEAWQQTFAIPKRWELFRPLKMPSRPTEIVVLKCQTEETTDTSSDNPAVSSQETLESTSIALASQQLLLEPFQRLRWRLAYMARYRHEFLLYVFCIASFMGCGYIARFWITGTFYFFLKIADQLFL